MELFRQPWIVVQRTGQCRRALSVKFLRFPCIIRAKFAAQPCSQVGMGQRGVATPLPKRASLSCNYSTSLVMSETGSSPMMECPTKTRSQAGCDCTCHPGLEQVSLSLFRIDSCPVPYMPCSSPRTYVLVLVIVKLNHDH